MTPAECLRFTARWPDIKAEWLQLLHGEPVLSPLGRPDTLVYLMDATLVQLLKGLQTGKKLRWLQRCTPVAGSVHRHCACGLNPLLKYFTTGELALRAAASDAVGPEIEEILLLFRALAQHEVDALCSVCQHPGWAGCELRREPPPATPPHPPG